MNAREEIHGRLRANVDMLERSAARAFLGCGISLLAGALWLLAGPVAKADVVTDGNVTAGDTAGEFLIPRVAGQPVAIGGDQSSTSGMLIGCRAWSRVSFSVICACCASSAARKAM